MTVRQGSVAVVANPVGAKEQSDALRQALSDGGVDVTWRETTEDDPGVGQSKQCVDEGASVVIACGGDGTVRACIESLAGTDTALAVVPAGTGNLLARNLGVADDPREALDIALDGGRRRIDVGYVNDEAFAIMAGAGLDAVIMRETSRQAKDRFGSLAYVKTAFEHLNDDPTSCIVSVEGRPVFSGAVSTVLAGNQGKLQGGIDVFPDSDPADGRLDLLAAKAHTVGSWARAALAVVSRREPRDLIERWTATTADVTFSRPLPYQLDGEERPAAMRLHFAIQPDHLTVCVPKETS